MYLQKGGDKMRSYIKRWSFLLLPILFLSTFGLHCGLVAAGVIEGTVTVAGKPTKGVRVSTDKNDFIATTNRKGKYRLVVSSNTYTITAWYSGFESVSRNDVKSNRRKRLNFKINKPLTFDEKTYVGSLRCKLCHSGFYFTWKESIHAKSIRSLKDKPGIVPRARRDFKRGLNLATVKGFSALNPAPRLKKKGNKFTVKIGNVVYKVNRTHGGNGFWKQRYQTKIGKSYYILPIQFNETTKEWVPYHLENWYNSDNQPLYTNRATLRNEINKTQSFEA